MNKEKINKEDYHSDILSPQEIWENEINNHISMKKRYSNYPKLPKSITNNVPSNKNDHVNSCLRGFYNRVYNWEKQNLVLDNI